MGAAVEWIGWVVEWFGRFVPRRLILDTTEGAVKYVGGSNPVPLAAGIHWWWPWTTKISEWPTARQSLNLRTQTILTADHRTIAVGGIVVYEVADLVQLIAYTHHADMTVADIALTAVHDVCCRLSWDDLCEGQRRGTLDTKLKNETQKALGPFGVTVLKTMLTDLAPCRVLKVVNATSSDGQ